MNGEAASMKKSKERPFYQPPENVATSSKIINEARTSLRTVDTKRPFTPREARTLFGPSSNRTPENRPPSAFSLGSHHFDGADSRPVSGTRLSPLDHSAPAPTAADIESRLICPKPPTDPNRQPTRKSSSGRSRLYHSGSVDSGCVTSPDSSQNNEDTSPTGRGVSSEERGEGDGKETPPRAPSSASRPLSSDEKEKRQSSGGSRKGSGGQRENDTMYTQHIAPLLAELMDPSAKRSPRLEQVIDDLYSVLHSHNLLGKSYRRRSAILKSLFKLLDIDNPTILLKLARLILSLNVSGNNLTNMCKLVFKVSRDETNDEKFVQADIFDLLVQLLHSGDQEISWEALFYCTGALKFLTANSSISKTLVKKCAIEGLTTLMERGCTTSESNGKGIDEIGNILVQTTASLRNLADASHSREHFLTSHTLPHICRVMTFYHHDCDLMLNISRLFSKLTLHTECCTVLAPLDSYKWFIHVLQHQANKENLVVRVCFVLGNLTAKSDQSRTLLYSEPGCMNSLLHIVKLYMDKTKEKTETDTTPPAEDVLVKVIRVIANLSISENVGPDLVGNKTCVQRLISILETRDITTDEELVLNTIACLNNLTYYWTQPGDLLLRISDCLLKLLNPSHQEALLESCRVFGNLTRHPALRDYLFNKKLGEMMIALLDSDNRELVYTACGVLVNFMADEAKRMTLKKESGITKLLDVLQDLVQCIYRLLDVLQDLARGDWHLASVVCQLLWNYSSRIRSCTECFGDHDTQRLSELLIELTDEQAAFDGATIEQLDDDEVSFMRDVWRTTFYPVATDLLQRVEKHSSQFEPLRK